MKQVKLLFLIMTLLVSVAANAGEWHTDDKIYQTIITDDRFIYAIISDSTVILISAPPGYTLEGHYDIPSTVESNDGSKTYTVVGLHDHCFFERWSVESVSIPNSVKYIGKEAFLECPSLKSVTIGNGLEEVGTRAFWQCDNLESVYISDLVAWCNISFDSSVCCNPLEYASHLYVNGVEVNDLVIPESVKRIGMSAFWYWKGLRSVTIPGSVETIGDFAFEGCENLESVTINEGVKSIGETFGDVFRDCTSLTSVTIPGTVTSIMNETFSGCSALPSITIPSSVTAIGSWAFQGCSSLKSVTIPSSVTKIDYWAFRECSSLKEANIPSSVREIGSQVFGLCTALESVKIENGVDSIGEALFLNCSSLTSIEIPESIKRIGDGAFWECSNLKSVTFQGNVSSFGHNAFWKCENLESVYITDLATWCSTSFDNYYGTSPLNYASHLYVNGAEVNDMVIPEGTKSIGEYAFWNFKGLTSVTIPGTVETIGRNAFWGCENLKTATIENGVKTIGFAAFYGSGLTSVTIPSSVTEIGELAFHNCEGLTSVTSHITSPFQLQDNIFFITRWNDSGFEYAYPATLYVPAGTVDAYVKTGWAAQFEKVTDGASGDVYNEDGAIYKAGSDNTATVMSCGTTEGDYEIPQTVTCDGVAYTVTAINQEAFKDNADMTSVSIPETVTAIGEGAFAGCSGLTAIYCYASEPADLGSAQVRTRTGERVSVFEGVNKDACVLYVPKGSLDKYMNAEGWKEFKQIVEMDGTGISSLFREGDTYDVYDMSGRRLRKASPSLDGLPKGLYIVNGKKVLVQ